MSEMLVIIQQIDKNRVEITITEPVFNLKNNNTEENPEIIKELRQKMQRVLDFI